MLSRKKTRELLMQLVYQMTLLEDFSESASASFLEEHADVTGEEAPDMAYFDRLLEAIREHLLEIDEMLEVASDHWKIRRIAKVDLAILRLAAAEIRYLEDIPQKVSIDEAVQLGRKYGGDNSSKFVNGVLGRLVVI
jgi:N utilization substance protein B